MNQHHLDDEVIKWQHNNFDFQIISVQASSHTESACTFPSYLIGEWTDVAKGASITFQTTSPELRGWEATGGQYFDANTFTTQYYYMCMKITRLSDDELYYYLLSDTNQNANSERIYTPIPRPDVSTTPACDYCQFTQTIPDSDFRELRKSGTIETITSDPELCLPCEATCDAGTTGPKGDKGDTGTTGPKGDKGDTGTTGPKGDKGDTGTTGPKGDKGNTGMKGDTGTIGETGDKGDKESPVFSITGMKGDTGPTGQKGDTGSAGSDGSPGKDGKDGKDVIDYCDPNMCRNGGTCINDNDGFTCDCDPMYGFGGPTCEQKLDPPGPVGEKGDKGEKGEKGEKGLKGEKGDIGYTGPKGGKGETGNKGLKGNKGDTGNYGPEGPTGQKGPTGPPGLKGRYGREGRAGPKGGKGDKGNTGPTGPTGQQGMTVCDLIVVSTRLKMMYGDL
ncbi:collagen alpha-2(I) chain-like [Mytilus californianus]|uniref:collagen alpha-2(I) chain-like n=1 Tax=Mytilus californianus TaxID=6549 RepID=UPI002247FD49|nr:collagen alpha-2(I) chain-like [Mytilus californianus]